ncbi:hypothetical protein AB4212_29895, partial [Streptomyces sp. 2MCAF27]
SNHRQHSAGIERQLDGAGHDLVRLAATVVVQVEAFLVLVREGRQVGVDDALDAAVSATVTGTARLPR